SHRSTAIPASQYASASATSSDASQFVPAPCVSTNPSPAAFSGVCKNPRTACSSELFWNCRTWSLTTFHVLRILTLARLPEDKVRSRINFDGRGESYALYRTTIEGCPERRRSLLALIQSFVSSCL